MTRITIAILGGLAAAFDLVAAIMTAPDMLEVRAAYYVVAVLGLVVLELGMVLVESKNNK